MKRKRGLEGAQKPVSLSNWRMAVPYLVTVSLLVNKHFLNVCSGPDPVLVQAPGLPHPTPALVSVSGFVIVPG